MIWGVFMKIDLKRIIPLISCFAIVLAFLVVPVRVSADAVDKSIVNLMPATSYRYTENGVVKGEAVKPFRFFQSVTSASWRWNTALLDTGFTSFVITVQVQRGIVPSKVTMIPYVGASPITLTKMGSSGDYIQYVYDGSVNLSYTEIVAEWSGTYTGRFNIVSFYGILGDIVSITKAARQIVRYTYSSSGFVRGQPSSAGAESLPLYLETYQNTSADFYDVYNFGIRKTEIPFRYLEEMTFFIATTSPDVDVSVYVAEDKNIWSNSVIYKTLPVDVSLSFTADTEDVSVRYYNLYYYSVTVDLSGVDLYDKMINLTFNAFPADSGYTAGSLLYVAARPPVEEIPWYQTFYQWIKGLFDSNTDALSNAIGSGNDTLVNGTPEQQQQVAAGKDNLESGADDLEQLTQDMQVTKPTVNAGDFSADVVLSASGMQLMGTPFAALWQSPTLVSVVVALVSIMLISFLFFGKKG